MVGWINGWMDKWLDGWMFIFSNGHQTQSFSIIINSLIIQGTECIHKMYT